MSRLSRLVEAARAGGPKTWLAGLGALWAAPLIPALWGRHALEHDSVNLALAASKYDLRLHQPHPAGFPYWVGLIRLVGLSGADPLLAQTILALAFTVAAAVLWRRLDGGRNPGGEFLLLLSPVAWFYAAVPSTYAVDLAFSCLALLLGRRAWQGDGGAALRLAVGVGVWSGFRSASAVFLLPLVLACGWRTRRLGWCGAAFGALWLAWYVPVVWWTGGPREFGRLMGQMTDGSFAQTSIFYGAPLAAHAHAVLSSAIFVALMLGPAVLAALVAGRGAEKRAAKAESEWTLAAWMGGPALLFLILVHAPKPGYFLILLPPVLAALLGRVRLTRRVLAVSAAASVACSFFPYEVLVGPANGYNLTRGTLRSLFLTEEAYRAIAALPPEGRISVVTNRAEAPNRRTLRYHFPGVEWTAGPGGCVVVANPWDKVDGGRLVSSNAVYALWRRDCDGPGPPGGR
jgi:hypothetical protein